MYRMLRPFEYVEPATIGEATAALSQGNGKVKILAGGVDLVPKMRRREESANTVVSIQRIKGLDHVKGDSEAGLKIGALAPLRSVELSDTVANHYSVLYEAVYQIASIQVKTMGTLVGNLCVATPASDIATVLLALKSTLRIAGPGGEREVPLEEFYTGPGTTVLSADEMVVEVLVPPSPEGTGGAFLNLSKTKADIAKVSAATVLTVENGICRAAGIALGAVGPRPIRCITSEKSLVGQRIDDAILEEAAVQAADMSTPITDVRSEDEYRREMVSVLVRRGLIKALERTKA